MLMSAICGMAAAQTLSIPDVEILAGGKAILHLTVNVGDKTNIVGLEWEGAVYPEGISPTGTVTKWDTDAQFIVSGSKFTAVAMPKGNPAVATFFPTGEVELGTIEIQAESTVKTGDYTITIPAKNCVFVTEEISYPVSEDVKVNVKVVDRLTLKETSSVLPVAANGINVSVVRTIKQGKWNTICLPFAMTAEKWKAAFGDKAEIRRFKDYKVKDGNIIVEFEAPITAALAANYPHIIKTSKDVDITSFDVDAVNLNPNEATAKKVFQYEDEETGEMADRCYFAGVLKAGTVIPEDGLFLNDGKFYYSTGKTTSNAFRGYFWFKDKISDASRVIMSFDDATGIKNVKTVNDNETVFDLQGRPVENPAKGVYIMGGKKVLVK